MLKPPSARNRFASRRLLRRILTTALGATLAMGLGCDRNIEAFQPGEEPRSPDLGRIFPAPEGGVGDAEAAQTASAASGLPARQALPPSRAEATPPAVGTATEASAPILGEIDIAPELAASAPAGGILFVIARPSGARGGPPLAVLRVADPSFPLSFSIGPENVMIPSMKFAGSISVSARLDEDGNAMTRGAGDLSSPTAQNLTPGSTDVKLILSEKG